MSRESLIMVRRLPGRCYYCGEKCGQDKLTCRRCNQLPDKDPNVEA